jgi:hypothetical protein
MTDDRGNVDQIGRDELEPLLRTDDGGQLRPLALEAFLAFNLLAFGDLFESGSILGRSASLSSSFASRPS